MKIHTDTIHFDDRPWSVRGYIYQNKDRFRFTVPEDLIFKNTQKKVLTPHEMIDWVKQNVEQLEQYCIDFAKRRNELDRPLADEDDIIIIQI